MAQTDDEKPQVEDEAQDAPEVVAHAVDDAELSEFECKIFVEI
ncbi:hypothetical protein EDD99_1770 [Streptomyces sp. 846.5]|nr:hypothetical protein [Streptomyces sp. 846.5]TDU03348.1 hypothetical protein EDD99_1770 [Streptomyces sp. 846.5]